MSSSSLAAHPGGSMILEAVAGKGSLFLSLSLSFSLSLSLFPPLFSLSQMLSDATEEFFELHRSDVLEKYQSLCIGVLDEGDSTLSPSSYFDSLSRVLSPFLLFSFVQYFHFLISSSFSQSGVSEIPFAENVALRAGWSCPYLTPGHLKVAPLPPLSHALSLLFLITPFSFKLNCGNTLPRSAPLPLLM
jgi:hypothetical protein